ncbi:cation/H(+) antiporter 1 [Syzygium oleosum]|uniref:cation/H(+) antiporter 1 n=1 Tax=Syzygium oleosum TaxID=219896 RepID=UPI0024BAFA85|nr:cation/H(+) antiporter 1 [Syzygium oleosum]
MNATQTFICQPDLINPLTTMGLQMSGILVLSHLFHLAMKAVGNSGPVAQILAGFALGPTGLSRIDKVKIFLYEQSTKDYYPVMEFFFSIIFMFQIGLETDISYAIRTLRPAGTIAYGGIILSVILGGTASFFSYRYLDFIGNAYIVYGLFVIIVLANAAPPAVIRLTAELKIATSDLGRLAVCSSVVNDMSCLFLYALIIATHSGKGFGRGILCLVVTVGLIFLNKYLALWFNRRNRNQKYLKNTEVFVILSLVIATSMIIELMSYNSSINCFLLGLMFPREGKSARTLLFKLTYSINNFILPIYFGYIGFQFNGNYFQKLENIVSVILIVVLSIVGKVGGTLAACKYMKIPLNEGVLIGFLLNMKGHADLVLLSGVSNIFSWTLKSHDLLLITIVINTVISGVVISIIMRKEEKRLAQAYRSLELQDPENELRLLACVYGPRHVAASVGIISALRGPQTAPITPYLMHLVELPEKHKAKSALYHELEDEEIEVNEDDYGGNDVVEINDAVDAFTADTKVLIQQIKAVSTFSNMYEDICDYAEDLRVSIILVPFHKHQRIDGKMESGKEGIRTTNQRVLRHAPCSVGIIVNRGPGGAPGFTQILSSETTQHVATLFFGGPDDQEALACSKRIATHPCVNLTVIRFVPSPSSSTENAAHPDDDVLLADFYNRHVRSGQVRYVEKCVNNGTQTVAALTEMGDMYTLFIVGRGRRGQSPMTTGMSDWEECPELGIVGDVLASSEFSINGSVLIIQQHRNPSI